MANVSFHGTGTTTPQSDQVGIGEGLQVGLTEIDFDSGNVSLVDNSGRPTNIGRFVGLHASDSEGGVVKSVIFKARVSCTVIIDKMLYAYENINQWITFNHLNTQRMQITRLASGQNPDVFDFDFQASDDPEYRFTIQNSNQDAQSEIVFPTLSRAVASYTQTINFRGAKKIRVALVTGAGTGSVTITAEYFDVASGTWIEFIPKGELWDSILTGQSLTKEIGDTISKTLTLQNSYFAQVDNAIVTFGNGSSLASITGGGSGGVAGANPPIGTVLPSGDNIFRFKAVVAGAALAFSLGITKVFG